MKKMKSERRIAFLPKISRIYGVGNPEIAGNGVSHYQFTVGIHLDVILVSVMRFIAFLRPTCIGVLLRQLSMNII